MPRIGESCGQRLGLLIAFTGRTDKQATTRVLYKYSALCPHSFLISHKSELRQNYAELPFHLFPM
ncbi:hypothetical protein, partial [Gluconobacter sp. DsW_056]|uniref:hypothetical protein n=1 Tax=Gluconobacter sp. DsW_056 TaxID=1511209 RepID=UPI001E571B14